jgi:RNA polymerase sigma-70 factor (ECF subfamily)
VSGELPERAESDQLLTLARRGDPKAQEEMLRGLQDVIYRYCLSQLAEADAAREASQETALRILRGLPRFRGDSRMKTWALGIALNVCREMRRAASHQLAGVEITPDELPTSDLRPDELAVGSEVEEEIVRLVHRLPDRQREAIVLRYFEELSVEETAAAMNVASGTVKATIWQALRRLRLQMENNDAAVAAKD